MAAEAQAASPLAWLGIGRKSETQGARITSVSKSQQTPTVLTKISQAPRQLVNNTKNLFVSKKQPSRKGASTVIKRQPRTEQKQPGFFKQLFRPEPPPPPRTVEEWMSLEQIHP
jgi:hypothetical protein